MTNKPYKPKKDISPKNKSGNEEPNVSGQSKEQQQQAILNDLQLLSEEIGTYSIKLGLSRAETLDLLQHRETIILNKQLSLLREKLK